MVKLQVTKTVPNPKYHVTVSTKRALRATTGLALYHPIGHVTKASPILSDQAPPTTGSQFRFQPAGFAPTPPSGAVGVSVGFPPQASGTRARAVSIRNLGHSGALSQSDKPLVRLFLWAGFCADANPRTRGHRNPRWSRRRRPRRQAQSKRRKHRLNSRIRELTNSTTVPTCPDCPTRNNAPYS